MSPAPTDRAAPSLSGGTSIAASGGGPVLTTKITMPARRSGVIGRARLLARMDSPAAARRLTVIVAPAGFGKTTLVREWCAARRDSEAGENSGIASRNSVIAWVSLDGSEDDPARFLTYLTMAVRVVHPDFGEGGLALLRSPQPAPRESVLTLLLNDLHTLPAPLCLVLDDYHLITERAVHEAVAYLLDHLPPTVHLVIASRVDPPLPLSRLRVRGELTELRAADLRCLGDEARAFLTGVMGLSLADEDIAALDTRTEGWMAGLQLAALSLQNRSDAKAFITAFTGSNRYIVDYLGEEVLRQQPERLRRFLSLTSVLHRLSGPLCDAVLGDEATPGEGQGLLEEMEAANLFLIALDDDRRWYRYHHLFGDMLRVRLQQEQPNLLPELHRRAADWYAREGMDDEAVHHALAGRHYETAARLMERSVERLWRRGETQTLTRWLAELPDMVRRGSARLCLFQARMHIMAAETERMIVTLEDAERALSSDDPDYPYLLGQARTHRAYLARMQGDDDRAMVFAEEALETLASSPSDIGMWPAVVRILLGTIHAVRGSTDRAVRMLAEAAEVCERIPDPQVALVARSIEAVLHEEHGLLRRAEETYRRGLDFVASRRMEQLPMGYVYVGLGSIALARNELETAEDYVRRGLTLGGEANAADVYLRGTRILAFVRLARGDRDDARTLLNGMAAFARNITLPQMREIVAVTQARFHLAVGELEGAEAWEARLAHEGILHPDSAMKTPLFSQTGASSVFLQDVTTLTLARLRLAQDRPHDTLSLLVATEENAVAQGRFSTEIECRVLAALAYQASGNPGSARTALAAALGRARPEGYVRLFLDAGPMLAPLLRDAGARGIEPEYARMLLAALVPDAVRAPFDSPSPRPAAMSLLDPLTNREVEVLGLVADGLSNAEIAERLFLSVGTVKRHVHNIFGKLDAGGRVEAIARARALGIL